MTPIPAITVKNATFNAIIINIILFIIGNF